MPEPDFQWTDKLTEFALRNVQHATWAVAPSGDILRVVQSLEEAEVAITKEELGALIEKLRVKIDRGLMKHLRLLKEDKLEDRLELTTGPKSGDRPGFYTGQSLAEIIKDLGLDCQQAKNILGHNFILHAREALTFCSWLSKPGLPKDYLKGELLDHYVFNQKLSLFKFENLPKLLTDFGVIKEGDRGWVIDQAPPVLTFYQMASSYFFLSRWKVNHWVDAKELLRQVDNVIPSPQRHEDYSALGFNQFPIEGWGKHQARMSTESFSKMLQIGLIETETIARILLEIARDKANSSLDSAKNAASRIKDALLKSLEKFKKPKPIGYEKVVSLLEQVENSLCH